MQYNRVYSTHHRRVLEHAFKTRVIYPRQIYEYNRTSAFVYDIYDIENSNTWDMDRVSAHVRSDPGSRIYINLSSENCTPAVEPMKPYLRVIKRFSVDPDRITVLCSQPDVIDFVHDQTGVAGKLFNFWELHTRTVVDEYPTTPEPDHRLVTLNRRYSPERAWAIYRLWPHVKNVYYTLGSTPGWYDVDTPSSYYTDEWRGYDQDTRDQVFAWQNTEQPWRNLDEWVDHTEWDTGHLLQAQTRGEVALVIESRVRTKLPRRPAFITEKTYRCFALGIPAIVVGYPRTRSTLESQGYQLPEYDNAYDYAVQLASCNDKQFRKQLKQLHRIAEHNKQNFYSRTA
jgi:hypothetical protein